MRKQERSRICVTFFIAIASLVASRQLAVGSLDFDTYEDYSLWEKLFQIKQHAFICHNPHWQLLVPENFTAAE
jgi:hypothetical protein